MEYENQLKNLLKNKDMTNLTLAYMITVEAGVMTFIEFLMMLMVSTHPLRETNNGVEIPGVWNLILYRDRTNEKEKLHFTLPKIYFHVKMTINKNNYSYLINITNMENYKYPSYMKSFSLNKNDISNNITALLKKETIYGHKSGLIKFVGFLILMEHLETNHIDEIHKYFKKFIHL